MEQNISYFNHNCGELLSCQNIRKQLGWSRSSVNMHKEYQIGPVIALDIPGDRVKLISNRI